MTTAFNGSVHDDVSPTLDCRHETHVVCMGVEDATAYSIIADTTPKIGTDICGTLRAQGGGGIVPPSVVTVSSVRQARVRRLMPVECERLQGFPDDWTKIPYRNKPSEKCPDAPRYKAIGNSWAVPVVHWLGKRIAEALNED